MKLRFLKSIDFKTIEVILDYLDGPNLVTRVLKIRYFHESVREIRWKKRRDSKYKGI